MSHDCILPKGLYMSSEKRKYRYESNSQITTSDTQTGWSTTIQDKVAMLKFLSNTQTLWRNDVWHKRIASFLRGIFYTFLTFFNTFPYKNLPSLYFALPVPHTYIHLECTWSKIKHLIQIETFEAHEIKHRRFKSNREKSCWCKTVTIVLLVVSSV